jgi:hypothetical protein
VPRVTTWPSASASRQAVASPPEGTNEEQHTVGQTGRRAASADSTAVERVSTDLVGRLAVDLLRTDSALCR